MHWCDVIDLPVVYCILVLDQRSSNVLDHWSLNEILDPLSIPPACTVKWKKQQTKSCKIVVVYFLRLAISFLKYKDTKNNFRVWKSWEMDNIVNILLEFHLKVFILIKIRRNIAWWKHVAWNLRKRSWRISLLSFSIGNGNHYISIS